MSYGLTPYDKKSYKASKRRRKQALKADKTGRIEPLSAAKYKIIFALCIGLAILLAVCGYLAYKSYFINEDTSVSVQNSQSSNAELLQIVNSQNPLDSTYVPKLENFQNVKVNPLLLESLKDFSEEAKKQSVELKIISSYISYEEQDELYNQTLNKFLEDPDYTPVRAQAAAQRLVPKAGNSEAQTGLLITFDVSDKDTMSFVERNCVNFGFILRYPKDKEDITHLNYIDNVYRFVGTDNALKMRSYNMCLEEYAEYLSLQKM